MPNFYQISGEYNKQMQRFNVGEDCPVFDGLYEFCQLSAGGSVASAVKLNKQVNYKSIKIKNYLTLIHFVVFNVTP